MVDLQEWKANIFSHITRSNLRPWLREHNVLQAVEIVAVLGELEHETCLSSRDICCSGIDG